MIILVTEDVQDTRDLMKMLLEHEGHEVYTAADGMEAVRAASTRVHDIILMDLRMPVMDGSPRLACCVKFRKRRLSRSWRYPGTWAIKSGVIAPLRPAAMNVSRSQ